MRIVLLTSGSRGDVQPFVALGVGLKKKGYMVCIATGENFEEYVTSYGLDFFAIQGDISKVMDSAEIENQMKAKNPISFILSFNEMNKTFRKDLDEGQEKAWEVSQNADILIFHPGLMNGYYICKKLGIPGILASSIPFTPTSEYPSLLFYNSPTFCGWCNRLTHFVFNHVFWSSIKPSVEKLWKKLDPSIRVKNPITQIHKEEFPVLYSISRYVIPPSKEWKDNIKVSGYWFPENDFTPPDDLATFLDSGSEPVYVGFGSVGKVAEKATRAAVESLVLLDKRVIVSSSKVEESWLEDERVFFLESAPHTWLFPRMSMVVHHGGAGTTAAGLLAGKPCVVVPQSNDQPMWAKRVQELGCGAMVKAGRDGVSVEKFIEVFKEMEDEAVVNKAREMGELIKEENGVSQAVDFIVKYLQGFE